MEGMPGRHLEGSVPRRASGAVCVDCSQATLLCRGEVDSSSDAFFRAGGWSLTMVRVPCAVSEGKAGLLGFLAPSSKGHKVPALFLEL